MPELPSHIQEILPIESFLLEIYQDLNEQHTRVLAMLFRLGGYTTLNLLTKLLGIAQSTVSVRVQELVDQGLLRKNPELMPIVLVLLTSSDDLNELINTKITTQQQAIKFLEKASILTDKHLVEKKFLHAFDILLPHSSKLAKLSAWVYLKEIVSRDELYNLVRKMEQKEEMERLHKLLDDTLQDTRESKERSDTIVLSLTRQMDEQVKMIEDMQKPKPLWQRFKSRLGWGIAG